MADNGGMIEAMTRLRHLPATPPLLPEQFWRVFTQCQLIINGAAANGSTAAAIPPLVALVVQELRAALASAA